VKKIAAIELQEEVEPFRNRERNPSSPAKS